VLRTLDPCRALGATLTFALTLGACGTTHSATRGAEDPMTQRRKQQVVALLNSIQTGDAAAIAVINPDKYLQHNLAAADGLAGFGALLAQLPPGSAKVDVVRVLADGDYVFTHTAYDFFGPKIGFDIFRFEGDRIVEHWDNLQQTPAGPNPSGRSMIDGAREPTDLGATEANKARVRAFVEEVLVGGHGEKLGQYLSSREYLQHNPQIADGIEGLTAALGAMAASGVSMKYHRIHRVLGEGNLVLVVSEGEFAGKPTSFYDLFRVADGLIVEHWDVIETIPPRESWKNDNGKF